MTSVLVRNSRVVKTISPSRPLTTAESANGGTRRAVTAGLTVYIGGTVTPASGTITGITNPNALTAVQQHRLGIKTRLRELELTPVANWGLRDAAAQTKATNFWWWLEMLGAGASVDANLADTARRALIEGELALDGLFWYNVHRPSVWDGLRDTSAFYSTQRNGNWSLVADMLMPGAGGRPAWVGLAKWLET